LQRDDGCHRYWARCGSSQVRHGRGLCNKDVEQADDAAQDVEDKRHNRRQPYLGPAAREQFGEIAEELEVTAT